MSVSVILVNWNSGNLLEKCLQHLELQKVLPERIFVVDNASTDGSADIKYASSRVRILKMASNLGFAAANNRALIQCTTEFVALLNVDAFPEPDWIEQLIKAAVKYPDFTAFGSRQLFYENPKVLDGIGDSYHFSGLVWRNRHGQRVRSFDKIDCEIFSPCAAAAMYRRSTLLKIGGFDEDYFCYVEDVDLGFRLRLSGYRAMYVSDAIVQHMGSVLTGGQRSDFSVYHGHRNLVWTYIKNMPGALFWFSLPFHLFLNLVTVCLFTFRGQLAVILNAKLDAIKGVPRALKKRKQIQKKRIAKIKDIWQVLNKHVVPQKKRLYYNHPHQHNK
jgi:GT2 family glycosyltransferase